jgi:hypothetical protein
MRARHYRWWRGHLAFGRGVLMDWIGHHNDVAHWALGMDQSGPLTVEAVGWTFPETDAYNSPHHYEIRCEYSGGSAQVVCRPPFNPKDLITAPSAVLDGPRFTLLGGKPRTRRGLGSRCLGWGRVCRPCHR